MRRASPEYQSPFASPRGLAARRVGRFAVVGALLLAGCGEPGGTAVNPTTEPGGGAIAPECDDVERLVAEPADDAEPTGSTAEPVRYESMPEGQVTEPTPDAQGRPRAAPEAPLELPAQIEQWGQQEAADSYAGVWLDYEIGGFVVAFARDIEDYAQRVRERFHPGLAIAEATNTYADLRDIQHRISQEQMGQHDQSGAIRSAGVHVTINRATVGILDPDAERLAELSEMYGAGAICFEIEAPPQSPSNRVRTLAKAPGWRDGLGQLEDVYALVEVAYDRETAQRAWDENVPGDLQPRDDEQPAEPGRYGGLDEVDLERQAVVVWSSGESGSCPEWLVDIETVDDRVRVQTDATADVCTADYNPYRLVVAVDRAALPQSDELAGARIQDDLDIEIRPYPGQEGAGAGARHR